jgi:acyl-CoA synthetase (NDP forming)
VAVVGASPRLDQIGGRPLRFLLEKGYSGRVYPVDARRLEIGGVRCYPRIEDLPEAPDVALIMTRASLVPGSLEACARRGIPFAVVFAAGFAEASEGGRALEDRIRGIVEKTGLRVVGPNCYGCLNVVDGIPLGFAAPLGFETYPKGPVGLFSQSGAFGFSFLSAAAEEGVGFSYLVNTGNSVDVELGDFLEFAAEDRDTSVVAGYVEGIRDGVRFARAARSCLAAGKPVVLLKVGGVAASERAIHSHTGALAGSRAAFEAAAARLGVVTVRDPEELLDVTRALMARQAARWDRRPFSRRVAVITTTGASGILFAEAGEDLGLELPVPREETLARLSEVLPPYATPANPVDTTAAVLDRPRMLEDALGALENATEFGSAAVLLSMPGPELARPFAEGIRSGAVRFGRPVVAAVAAGPRYTEDFRALMAGGPIPVFASPRRAALALRAILDVEERFSRREAPWEPDAPCRGEVPEYLGAGGPCGEPAAKRFFSERGLPVPRGRIAASAADAVAATRELGVTPVVAKTGALRALHKAQRRLVRMGISSEEEALRAFEEIRAGARAAGLVEGGDSVLFEEERTGGGEVFLGARRDPAFGLLIGVGAGGSRVEARSAVCWELAPLDAGRVESLVSAVRSWGLLEGPDGTLRDADGLDRAIVDFYEAVRGLGERLVEAEVNPLAVFAEGGGVCALDAVLELAPVEAARSGGSEGLKGPGAREPSSAG